MSTQAGGTLFKVGYFFYSKTRLGYYYHKRNIDKAKSLFTDGHSVTKPHEYNGLRIVPIALIEDNYSYLVIDQESKIAAAIDPSDATAVQAVIESEGVELKAVLTTHKHWKLVYNTQELVTQKREYLYLVAHQKR